MIRKNAKKGPGRPGRLSAEQAAELPDRLLDAAKAQFAEVGYADSTMEQVARRAGASTKTLYSRYANKTELLKAVVNRIIEQSLRAHAAAVSADPKGANPRDFLVSLGQQIVIGLSTTGVSLIQIALAEARRFPELAATYNATLATGASLFGHALETWKAEGHLPDLPDTERAARLCISMLTDAARIRAAMGEPMTEEEGAAHVALAADIFLRGCGYDPKRKP
jgi:AcrR family transcriptional regulator